MQTWAIRYTETGRDVTLADAHRQAALDLEQTIADLGDPAAKPYIGRTVIDSYWGAAFHWIAYACQQDAAARQGGIRRKRAEARQPARKASAR